MRDSTRFGKRRTQATASKRSDGSRYSLYASSSTTTTCGGTDATKASIRSAGRNVPVGLFGFATNTIRVSGAIAARIASRSWPRPSVAGTTIARAPVSWVASAYTANEYCE